MEGKELSMAENSSPTVNRIFIGGLGASVKTADLKHIFSSLGKIKNVEFVRTNGRDFAYVDFEPQSDKSLQKLFSIYNGCKWKGGKLRLEKAKEHYLTRMKREWAEDSMPVPEPVPSNQEPEKDKSKKLNLDSTKISIFFPKSKKMKELPYKGSGKHKYSFQRVELSSTLPLHFCDCEEHCGPQESVNETYTSALDKASHDKERSIMNSVMDRLLKMDEERENNERGEKNENENEEEEEEEEEVEVEVEEEEVEERESEEREEIPEEEEEESDGDIVINISSRQSDELMLDNLVKETLANKKELQEKKQLVLNEKTMQNQEEETFQTVEKDEKEEEEEEEEEDPPVKNEEDTTGDEFSSVLAREKDPSSEKTETEPTTQKSNTNKTWFQKSAWRDLFGDSNTSLFSSFSTPQVTQQTLNSNIPNQSNPSNESQVTEPVIPKQVSGSNEESKKRKEISKDGESVNKEEVRRVVKKVTFGEVCPFMRNEESEKEWNKTKKALSSYMKNKSDDSNKMRGKRGN